MDQSLLWAKQIAEGKMFPMSVNTSKAFVALPTGMKYLHENDLVHRDLKSSNGECCEHYIHSRLFFVKSLLELNFCSSNFCGPNTDSDDKTLINVYINFNVQANYRDM